MSQSLESIDKTGNPEVTREDLLRGSNPKTGVDQEARNVLMPCDNGQSYSVSQNQIVHLPGPDVPSVKNRVSKLETQGQKRKGLVLNLTNQFEAATSKPSSPGSDSDCKPLPQSPVPESNEKLMVNGLSDQQAQTQQIPQITAVVLKKEVWDPGENRDTKGSTNDRVAPVTTSKSSSVDNSECLVWTASAEANCTNSNSNVRNGELSRESDCLASAPPPTSTISYLGTLGRKSKREGDPFSTQLDRVFDREERREEPTTRDSPSRQSSWSSYDSAVVLENSVHSSWATLPSRNSSWGSYDMRPADPLGSSGLFPYDKEEIPWHPGTVKRTKQKLEEGNGASTVKRVCTQTSDFDEKSDRLGLDTEDAPLGAYNPVLLHYTPSPTPRRRDPSPVTDQNLKAEILNDTPSPLGAIDITPISLRQTGRLSTSAPAPSSLSSETDLPLSLRTCRSESETSSPSVVNTPQCPSVKHHKMVLENLNNKPIFNKRCLSVDDSPESECQRSILGIVKNLKKEFEAKSSTKSEKSPENSCDSESCVNLRPKRDVKIRSLPSSPVIGHNESKIQSPSIEPKEKETKGNDLNSPSQETEDLSVKVLVGKYEIAKPEAKRNSDIQLRVSNRDRERDSIEVHPPAKSKIAPEFARRSAPMIINHSSLFTEVPESPGRPPIPSSSVVVASVVAKAASKKQQQYGRTHPLARLQDRPRHSSPVYNTM